MGFGEERNIWDVIEDNKAVLASFFFGAILVGLFVLVNNFISSPKESDIRIISEDLKDNGSSSESSIVVEVSGAVNEPGIFEFPDGTRVGTALDFAKGVSENASELWVSKNLNLAAKLTDGQKIYIPFDGEEGPNIAGISGVGGLININTAGESELKSLIGIGDARSKKIIGGRPYGSLDELVSRDIIPGSVFDEIKDKISVY